MVQDQVTGEGFSKVEEMLITQKEPVVEGNKIILKGEKGCVTVTVCGEDVSIQTIKGIFDNHRGKDEDVWQIRFEVPIKDKKANCKMICSYAPF